MNFQITNLLDSSLQIGDVDSCGFSCTLAPAQTRTVVVTNKDHQAALQIQLDNLEAQKWIRVGAAPAEAPAPKAPPSRPSAPKVTAAPKELPVEVPMSEEKTMSESVTLDPDKSAAKRKK